MSGMLIYDGDCGFCTSSVRFVERRISPTVDAVPWQRADLDALGLTEAVCQDAVQYRGAAGPWRSGGRAVAALLSDSRFPWRPLGWIARVPGPAWLVDRIYVWVSANRYKLPGGTPACKTGV